MLKVLMLKTNLYMYDDSEDKDNKDCRMHIWMINDKILQEIKQYQKRCFSYKKVIDVDPYN